MLEWGCSVLGCAVHCAVEVSGSARELCGKSINIGFQLPASTKPGSIYRTYPPLSDTEYIVQ